MANAVNPNQPLAGSLPAKEVHSESHLHGTTLVHDVTTGVRVIGQDSALNKPRAQSRTQQLNKLYSLPAPLRTFPLPTFVPHNPVSLFHILYTWLSHAIQAPSSHPNELYQAWYSPDTRSIHVTHTKTIRALWEQGFYGKGSLSRSEPSWLEREKKRRGVNAQQTSEEITRQRRAQRQQVKWERARKEREAIDQTLSAERSLYMNAEGPAIGSGSAQHADIWLAPVGPLEILRLPNSAEDFPSRKRMVDHHMLGSKSEHGYIGNGQAIPSPDVELNGHVSFGNDEASAKTTLTPKQTSSPLDVEILNSHFDNTANGFASMSESVESMQGSKSHKTVRFSPTVEKTTFIPSEPPSPDLAEQSLTPSDDTALKITDQEHLQLTLEEAMWLSYGLGILTVLDSQTKCAIPPKELFSLGRQSSYFPPSEPAESLLTPDDPFLLSYVVYHHFRSLGWVVRGGIKFSVDFLLYNRGPVFSHAEFAILILPSYSHAYWSASQNTRDYVSKKQQRRWSWLHCMSRVNTQVKKTLVLVYVDIPPPLTVSAEELLGIDGILMRYKVREIILKRWISNRSRD